MAREEYLHTKLWIIQEGILLDLPELVEMFSTSHSLLVWGLLLGFLGGATIFLELLTFLGIHHHCYGCSLFSDVCRLIVVATVIRGFCWIESRFIFLRFGLNLADDAQMEAPLSRECVQFKFTLRRRMQTYIVPDEKRVVVWQRRGPGKSSLERGRRFVQTIDAVARATAHVSTPL